MLAVTGIGMVSALGLDVVTSCAAARAGITRIAPLDDLQVADLEAEELVPVAGHQVPIISAGMFGFARLLQLAGAAVDDLRRSRPPEDVPPRLGMILLLRSGWHRAALIDRLKRHPPADDDDAGPHIPASTTDEGALQRDRKRLANDLLPALIARARLKVQPQAQRTILGDQTGFVLALQQAEAWLRDGTCEACWVGGVDSYLDPQIIGALLRLDVLRTPSNPVGLIPGEMACVLELTRGERRPPGSTAVIQGYALDPGPGQVPEEGPPDAEPLMRAMAATGAPSPDLSVVNLNGTTPRAVEWGYALVRRASQGLNDAPVTWIPPLHFGEIGSATGPASVAMLARGWSRGYAPGATARICLIEDGTARGAVLVNRAQ